MHMSMRGYLRHQFVHRTGVERLGEHVVCPAALEEVDVCLHHVSRHADDKAAASLLSQELGGARTVEHWHLEVLGGGGWGVGGGEEGVVGIGLEEKYEL
jgi:hypothetical protein